MKGPVLRLVGGTLIIMGCCAIATGGFFAWLVWGGDKGSWPMQMSTLTGNIESDTEISAVLGIGAIAAGLCLRRLKGTSI